MVRAAALAVLLIAASPPPTAEWIKEHAPYGVDITPDGDSWVNANPVGRSDDYAIRVSDFQRYLDMPSTSPVFWVRGYHARNKTARYRTSKSQINIDCARQTVQVRYWITYRADGTVYSSAHNYSVDPIIPGTDGEQWQKMVCAN